MIREWTEERSTQEPDALQLVAPNIYIERRNIEAIEHEETEESPAYTDYKCESREISVDEYNMLKSIEQISTSKTIDDYTMMLLEEGVL